MCLCHKARAIRPGKGFECALRLCQEANPELLRVATGAGRTTVMAILIAWQTVNAVRRPQSRSFTRGFAIITPGITIRDRLRVLQPKDSDSYYASRELIPMKCWQTLPAPKLSLPTITPSNCGSV